MEYAYFANNVQAIRNQIFRESLLMGRVLKLKSLFPPVGMIDSEPGGHKSKISSSCGGEGVALGGDRKSCEGGSEKEVWN